MHGRHPLKFWSRTQAAVSLSSAEAELHALVKASTEMIGMRTLMRELGNDVCVATLMTDASAAHGVIHRQGTGRMKHIHTSSLWIQERALNRDLVFRKIPREGNSADILTHFWQPAKIHEMLERIGVYVEAVEKEWSRSAQRAQGGVSMYSGIH